MGTRLAAVMPVLVITAMLMAPRVAGAQGRGGRGAQPPASPRAAAPIDLTGYWVAEVTEDWRWRMVTPAKGDYQSIPINAAAQKLKDKIAKKCGGANKTCNAGDTGADADAPLADIGWGIGNCPGLSGHGCTNAIADGNAKKARKQLGKAAKFVRGVDKKLVSAKKGPKLVADATARSTIETAAAALVTDLLAFRDTF